MICSKQAVQKNFPLKIAQKHQTLRLIVQSKKIKNQCIKKNSVDYKPATSKFTLSPINNPLPINLRSLHSWQSIMDSMNMPLLCPRSSYIDFYLTSKVNYVPRSERQINALYSSVYNWKKRFHKNKFSSYSSLRESEGTSIKPNPKFSISRIPRIKKVCSIIMHKINKLKKFDKFCS